MKKICNFLVAGNTRTEDMVGAVKEIVSAGQGAHLDPAVYKLFLELSLDPTSDKPLVVCIQIHSCSCKEASKRGKIKGQSSPDKGN